MNSIMETVATDKVLTINIPIEDFKPQELEDIISLVKIALISRKSKLTAEEAEAISEEIKASWWGKNKDRILKMIEENG